jgi:hypothetical protein
MFLSYCVNADYALWVIMFCNYSTGEITDMERQNVTLTVTP